MSMGGGGGSSSQSAPQSTTTVVAQPNMGGVQSLYSMANQQLGQVNQQNQQAAGNNPFTNQLLQMATNWQPPQTSSPSATDIAASVTAGRFNQQQRNQQFFNF